MKTSTFVIGAAIAAAVALSRRAAAPQAGESNQPMTNLVLSDIENQGMATPSGNLVFSSTNIIQANIAQRAIDEGWTTAQTLAALDPGYTDPNFGWTDRLTGDLKGQLQALLSRGSTYDMYHAAAIAAYMGGFTDTIVQWPTSGSGTAGRQAFKDAGLWEMLPQLYSEAQRLSY